MLQIAHSALGVVRSPLFTTCEWCTVGCLWHAAHGLQLTKRGDLAVIQVFSRLWALWGIIHQAPAATTEGSVKLIQADGFPLELNLYTLLTAWGVTEVLRYGFFAVKVCLIRASVTQSTDLCSCC